MKTKGMTDNEIIKALECCSSDSLGSCRKCPGKGSGCELEGYALALITRQKAEIERLKGWESLLRAESHALIKQEAARKFAERLCKDRVSNDPVVIAVKCELKEMEG